MYTSAHRSAYRRAGFIWAAHLFFLLLGLSIALPVPAQEAPAPVATQAAAPAKRFATVWRIQGEVIASADGKDRALKLMDPVFVGEKIRTGATSEAVLKTDDGGLIAVRPKAEFSAESYAADGKKSDSQVLKLITGSLRIISGWIGHSNRAGHQVRTNSATIGIRGTDHEPYELTPEMAGALGTATPYKAGTYDKVNRGGTTLSVDDQSVDINPGKAGFAPSRAVRTRALMTMFLPVLLDKVPEFYVPGQFDAELDRYARTADENNAKALKEKQKADTCDPNRLAKAWLKQLDAGLARRDSQAVIALFATDVANKATVKNKDGSSTTVSLSREEMVESTIAAVKSLKDYKQRRISVAGKLEETAPNCTRLNVSSLVVESGKMSGRPFRFESQEEFVLELRDGKWLAIKAETTQR